ncbi:MAG: peptidoglycan bridge formation glycyltransferase FemA/FemB family protein [Bacteroidetes bacterium]|nr:peptidoglycan bridge formation glycyltransferase FemA/FemB family protein [Bacteroidota bacterium]
MICEVEQKAVEEIRPTNILPQTPFWARIKNEQGFVPKGFQIQISSDLLTPNESDEKIEDDLLILIRDLSLNSCFAYVPYGPKLEPEAQNQGKFLEELSEVIRPYLPANCVFIRYDLMWENQWANEDSYFDELGNWLGPPTATTQEFRVNFNTTNWNLRKSAGDVLPKNTFFLDLKKDEEDLLSNMRFNTRYNIRKAFQKGIEVRESGLEMLDDWYRIYSETAARNQMVLHDKEYFSSIFNHQDESRSGVKVRLLSATYNDELLASMFLVLSRKRGIYLYGASSSKRRNMMASYALQWEAIKRAKINNCVEYDMFGCAPNLNPKHPLHGVHIYKKGFGGNLFHRMGCWDYPFQKKEYENFRIAEQLG